MARKKSDVSDIGDARAKRGRPKKHEQAEIPGMEYRLDDGRTVEVVAGEENVKVRAPKGSAEVNP